MVYLAELLVVMTDGLKIVRICVRNVPRTRTQALRPRRVSRVSLALFQLQESNGVTCSISRGAVLLKHKIIVTVSKQPTNVWLPLLSKKVAATVRRLYLDTKS